MPKRKKSNATPQKAFRLPILKALTALGGEAPRRAVLDKVETIMKDRLTKVDYERLPTAREIRWRNAAAWERKRMITEGLLDTSAPRGIWRITPKGKQYLKSHV